MTDRARTLSITVSHVACMLECSQFQTQEGCLISASVINTHSDIITSAYQHYTALAELTLLYIVYRMHRINQFSSSHLQRK